MGLNVETDILQIFDKFRIEIDDFYENRIAYLKTDTQYENETLIDNYEANRNKLFNLLDSL